MSELKKLVRELRAKGAGELSDRIEDAAEADLPMFVGGPLEDAPGCARCGCRLRVVSRKGACCPGCGALRGGPPLQEEATPEAPAEASPPNMADRWIGDLVAANASYAATLKELEAANAGWAIALKDLGALHSRLRVIGRKMRDLAGRNEEAASEPGALAYHLSMFAEQLERELPPVAEHTNAAQNYGPLWSKDDDRESHFETLPQQLDRLSAQVASLKHQRDELKQANQKLSCMLAEARGRGEAFREALIELGRE